MIEFVHRHRIALGDYVIQAFPTWSSFYVQITNPNFMYIDRRYDLPEDGIRSDSKLHLTLFVYRSVT